MTNNKDLKIISLSWS